VGKVGKRITKPFAHAAMRRILELNDFLWEVPMRHLHLIFLCALVAVAALAGCGSSKQGEALTVTGGEPITYKCEGGEEIVARYYALSDNSLHFVKVTLPDGQVQTLPNAVSASGARYTDDRMWVWWTKGETGFAETRNDKGEWETKYQGCQQVTGK